MESGLTGAENITQVTAAETLLLESLGLDLLSFVLNSDAEHVTNRLRKETELAPPQEAALRELVDFLGTVSQLVVPANQLSLASSLWPIGTYRPDLGTSWATATRLAAGGSADLPAASSDPERALLNMLRDVYPLLLLPEDADHFGFLRGPQLISAVFRHPENANFEKAVMADATLTKLFPEDNETGRGGSVYRSTGSGGGVQLSMFAEGILGNAWREVALTEPHPALDAVAKSALDQLAKIRKAIEGRRLTVTAMVGITGLRLPEGVEIGLPWGKLRQVRDSDHVLIPPGLSGKLTATTETGTQVVIDYAGDLVLETEVPYSIKIGPFDIAEPWPIELTSATELERRLETLRIALLLSMSRSPSPLALGTWSVYLDPLAIGGRNTSWRDPRKGRSLAPAALTRREATKWQAWVQIVDQRRVKNIDVAIRRTLLAAAERPDPTDALIDAIIAWENLLGSKEGEPTLRIAGAIAWLLGKGASDRQAIRRQVAELYRIRSDVVHGNRFLDPREAHDRQREAMDIIVRCLRAVFHDQPHLLANGVDSTTRSLKLLLNERPPTAMAQAD